MKSVKEYPYRIGKDGQVSVRILDLVVSCGRLE
jgi:hypothetical protein